MFFPWWSTKIWHNLVLCWFVSSKKTSDYICKERKILILFKHIWYRSNAVYLMNDRIWRSCTDRLWKKNSRLTRNRRTPWAKYLTRLQIHWTRFSCVALMTSLTATWSHLQNISGMWLGHWHIISLSVRAGNSYMPKNGLQCSVSLKCRLLAWWKSW